MTATLEKQSQPGTFASRSLPPERADVPDAASLAIPDPSSVISPPPSDLSAWRGFSAEVLAYIREECAGQTAAQLAREIGMDATVITRMVKGNYPGNVDKAEAAALVWIQRRTLQLQFHHDLIETEITRACESTFNLAQRTNDIVVIHGAAGVGLTAGCLRYLAKHPNALYAELAGWDFHRSALFRKLRARLTTRRLKRGENLCEDVSARLSESKRLIIVDGAHNLGPAALRALVDLHKKTGCPVALVGDEAILDRIDADPHVVCRSGHIKEAAFKDTAALARAARELVAQIAPEHAHAIADEAAAGAVKLKTLCSLARQTTLMAELLRRSSANGPVKAFAHAAGQLRCCKPAAA